MHIRPSKHSERAAIAAVHLSAFGPQQGPEIAELVDALLDDPTAAPRLSLVAEAGNEIIGHILFTQAQISPAQPDVSAQLLAPLAVASAYQGQGIGGSLIDEGLQRLKASGVELVFVLGHPGYYPRHGFRPAGALGLDAPYPIPPEHADAWMVQALRPGVIGEVQGTLHCAEALDQPRHWLE